MTTGYLVAFAGQSHEQGSGDTTPTHPTLLNVKMMKPTTRTFAPFVTNGGEGKWNAFLDSAPPTLNAPGLLFARKWQKRYNQGAAPGPLYFIDVSRGGTGFDVRYSVPNFTHWRADRQKNNGSGGFSGTFTIPTDGGGGVYPTGDTYSAYETLKQCLAAAKALILADGHSEARLLFVAWLQGQADATVAAITQAEYQAYEQSMIDMSATALGVSSSALPWISEFVKTNEDNGGDGSTARPGIPAINAAKAAIVSAQPTNRWSVDPHLWAEYLASTPASDPSAGGIYKADKGHWTNLGCLRFADECWGLTYGAGYRGLLL